MAREGATAATSGIAEPVPATPRTEREGTLTAPTYPSSLMEPKIIHTKDGGVLVGEPDSPLSNDDDLAKKLNMQIAQIVAPPSADQPSSSNHGTVAPSKSYVRKVSTSSVETSHHQNSSSSRQPQPHNESRLTELPSTAPSQDDAAMPEEAIPTPRRRTKKLSVEERLDVYQLQYETLQRTHNQMIQDFQDQLLEMQSQLQGAAETTNTDETPQNDDAETPIEEEKKEALSRSSLDELIASRSDDLLQLEEENLAERRRLQNSIERLLKKVDETSEKTQQQYAALQDELHGYSASMSFDSQMSGEGTKTLLFASQSVPEGTDLGAHLAARNQTATGERSIQNQAQFEQRLRTIQTLHTLELEAFRFKHSQQVIDMSGQLDAYQQQVEKQNTELQRWRKKYNSLEEMAVTPSEAKAVLKKLEGLGSKSTTEEHQQVYESAKIVLQRMAQLQSKQNHDRRSLQKTKDAALERALRSQGELEFLNLQKELLEDDTKVPVEEWQGQLAQQRKNHRRHLAQILREEEERLIEMEYLEVHLTELAYLAVEIENLEKEYKENHAHNSEIISKASKASESTRKVVANLQAKVKEVQHKQNQKLQSLEPSESYTRVLQERLDGLAKRQDIEEVLVKKDSELQECKAELLASQERIAMLEAQLAEAHKKTKSANLNRGSKSAAGLSMAHLGFPSKAL